MSFEGDHHLVSADGVSANVDAATLNALSRPPPLIKFTTWIRCVGFFVDLSRTICLI